jgi:monovalent cation:proton antiporter-2 (CPA2) family protein
VEPVSHYKEILLVLGASGLLVPLLVRVGVSSVLAYLLVGILAGPSVLGALAQSHPLLSGLALTSTEEFSSLAELGVVFLLFLIGLELSFERLNTMKRIVFGLGTLQVLATGAVIFIAARLLGYQNPQAVLLGMALSMSSTAIVIQLLSDSKRLGSHAGRLSFAVLLLQDLAVIPMLMIVALLGSNMEGNLATGVVQALVQAGLAVALIIFAGRYALRPLLRMVAATRNTDLFMASVLFIAVGTGALANLAGLSMSLGAFIAGLMLAETEYRRAIEAIIEPFKGLLLGAFFLLVGLGLDTTALLLDPVRILGAALLLVLLKAAIVYALGRAFKFSHGASLEAGLLLGPCGEFAFVIFAAAASANALPEGEAASPLLIVTLTMMMVPFLARFGRTMNQRSVRAGAPQMPEVLPPGDLVQHVIVVGYGRVGSLICSMLHEHKLPYIAVESDASLASRERKTNPNIYYGDATHMAFLEKCGLREAKCLVVTMDNPVKVDEIVRMARMERPDLKIVARARDERHAVRLYAAGATEAVPETIEASLQLGEAVLVESGVAMGLAIASIHERRDGIRKLLGQPNRREMVRAARRRIESRMP